MVITPLMAAIIVGTFWTGVGTTAVLTSDGFDRDRFDRDTDITITAEVDDDHVAACEAKYRSYNEETDMYLSFGGDWKRCTL